MGGRSSAFLRCGPSSENAGAAAATSSSVEASAPSSPVIAILSPHGTGGRFLRQELLKKDFEIVKTEQFEPTVGWPYEVTDVVRRKNTQGGPRSASPLCDNTGFLDSFSILHARCCVHGSGTRPRQMWPLLKTVIEAHNAVVVIALFDWRCGVPGPGDGSMDDPTYYGLSSEIRKSIERGFAPPDSPLAPHSALMHRRRLRQRATEEWKRLELLPTPERRQPPISTGRVGDNVLGEEGGRVLSVDDHQYQGSTPTVDVVDEQQARIDDERVDRNAKDMEDHHRNYFQNVGRPFFLDEQRRCPLAFGEKDTLQRAKDEVEWLRTWVENDGGGGARRSLQVLLNCDTPALACIRYWDRDEPLSFDLDFEKYRNTSAADLAATVRATRMSDNSAAEGRWGRTVLQAQDIERRARELLSLPETTQMRCVWLQDEATEELLAPPAEAPSSRILTENGVEHVLSDMLSRVK